VASIVASDNAEYCVDELGTRRRGCLHYEFASARLIGWGPGPPVTIRRSSSVGRESVGAAMLKLIGNILLYLVVAGAFFGGVTLFWIARQDDSRLGRILGVSCTLVAILVGVYLALGNHWL
jgi:hypothetical protein